MGRVWSFRDVTKRRQAEEALRQSEERYRVLFNASGDAMFAHGMTEDGQPRPFNMVNEVACQRYGYSQEELLRMTPLDLDAPEGRNMAPAAIQKLMGAKRVTWESQHQTKDGRYIPVEIAAVLIRYQGEVMVFSVARDITQRKQAEATLRENEEQLRQAVKLESIGRLAGGVAHDFNNLLMGIMGYIELCQGHPGVPDPIRHWLDEAMKGSRRSAEITRQLLAFASRQTIAPKVFDLNDRIAETLNLLRRLLGEEIDLRRGEGQILVHLCDGQHSLETDRNKYLPRDQRTVDILDLMHVLPRLWEAGHLFHAEGSEEASRFVRQRLRRVLEGEASQVISGLRRLGTTQRLKGARKARLGKLCDFLRGNLHRMAYDEYLRAGYPIATGVIEGACRHVIKDRMERAGMRWKVPGAQAMLQLRTIYANGDWQAFQEYRVQHETNRLYPHASLLQEIDWPLTN